MLFAHNTSRVEDEPYPNLLREKGFSGFPSLCFMDADGNVLIKQGERTVKGFAATLSRIEALAVLKKKLAAGGDAALERDVFMAELELGSLAVAEIKKRTDQLHLDAKDKARVDQFLVDAEVRDLVSRSRELGNEKVTSAIVDMARAGRRPGEQSAPTFWQATLRWCSKNGDPTLAQAAFDELDKLSLPAAMKKNFQTWLDEAKAAGKSGG